MKFTSLVFALNAFALVTAWPTIDIWSRNDKTPGLEGFALDNPISATTGGKGAKSITVTNGDDLLSAVQGDTPKMIYLDGEFSPSGRLRVGSHTTLLGKGKGANIIGEGVSIVNATNVIVRNIGIRFVEGDDAMAIQNSTRVWVDHCEFESQFSVEIGPDFYDGQLDIVRASDWITVSNNYFHDHWKVSLIGNSDILRDVDFGHLHITYHHNYWRNLGTRGPAGRFGHQHIYNNLYEDYLYQAIHSRSDNQVLVEGNKFIGNTPIAVDTYGLVIPEDSPNTCVCGDEELDGFANLGAKNDFGNSLVNITKVGSFKKAPYKYLLTPVKNVEKVVRANAGLGKVKV